MPAKHRGFLSSRAGRPELALKTGMGKSITVDG